MSQSERTTTDNRMLDALPQSEFARLHRHLEPVSVHRKHILIRAGEEIESVYFPVSSVISAVSLMEDGSALEVAMIGDEGLAGLSALLANKPSHHEMMVQGNGTGFRVPAGVLQNELNRSAPFREIVANFAKLLLGQITQIAACNRHHNLEARCARALLTLQDRLKAALFPLTHEFLAMLLGVQRTGVTAAAHALQRNDLIRTTHGRIEIVDRAGLEAASCECHQVIMDAIDGFLRDSAPR